MQMTMNSDATQWRRRREARGQLLPFSSEKPKGLKMSISSQDACF